MPGFQAGSAVEPLDFTFQPYSSVEGTIKEPTDQQLDDFLKGWRKLFADAGGAFGSDVDTPEAALAALGKIEDGDFAETLADISALYGELCSGFPSAAQMQELPLRVRVAFFAWLAGEVMSPEAGTRAGNGQVPTRLASAGR